ncbi:uncharacterized protein LOC130712955 [Lotus japonicus]|uniref:uncharacterized protein LOC130712955 n=1 Tax=Lotus japonicus TaxID=34305 RepID=UPI00258FC7E3|nr:uncharacterized protein LOC130712955 [Lotus japonicus]
MKIRRGSPPRRVRGRPRRKQVHREETDQLTPPPPPPPPPSPTPPLPSPPTSPEQQRSPVHSPGASGGETPAPQAPISGEDGRRLICSVDDIRQRNDYLQEQLEYYRYEQHDEGEREAEAVVEFEPFSAVVREVAIPDNMKNIVLETYSRKADPKEHLLYFNTKMVISAASNVVKRRIFPVTFKGTTMAWFTTLPRGSITNFRDFSSKFLVQFSASKTKQVTIEDLYNIRQSEGETLKQYVKRFSAASVKIEESEPQACARAFKNGLQLGKLNSKLSRKSARSMAEIRTRVNTYILDDEDDAFKRRRTKKEKDGEQRDASPEGKQNKERGEGSKRRDRKVRIGEKAMKEPLYPKRENFERRRPWHQTDSLRREELEKSLNAHLTELLREVKVTHAVEEGEKEADPSQAALDKMKWCEYHRSAGHDTGDFFTLKNEIERLIRAGRSVEWRTTAGKPVQRGPPAGRPPPYANH